MPATAPTTAGQGCIGASSGLFELIASAKKIYRVLYEVRSAPSNATGQTGCQLVSVAVPAEHADAARAISRQLLRPSGMEPTGEAVRTSDLTELLRDASENIDDSGFGESAAHWLKEVHDEAVRNGASIRVMSSDYGFLGKTPRNSGSNPDPGPFRR